MSIHPVIPTLHEPSRVEREMRLASNHRAQEGSHHLAAGGTSLQEMIVEMQPRLEASPGRDEHFGTIPSHFDFIVPYQRKTRRGQPPKGSDPWKGTEAAQRHRGQ